MIRTLLALVVLAAGLQAQAPNSYYVSADTTKLTVQQPAENASQVQFGMVTVYCAVAQTVTEEWNGAAATTTAGTIKRSPGTLAAPMATVWTASNVGTGTTGPVYNVPGGQTLVLNASTVRMGTTGANTSYSIGTNGTCTITMSWTEGAQAAPYLISGGGAIPVGYFGGGGGSVSGSVSITGTASVAGVKTANAAVPGATNVGALPCVANAAAPSFTETFQVPCSVDLTGNTRAVVVGPEAAAATAAGNPVVAAGVDTTGAVRRIAVATSTENTGQIANTGVQRVQMAIANSTGNTRNVIAASQIADGNAGDNLPAVAEMGFSGLWNRKLDCTLTASVSVSAAATTEIIPLTASQRIRICSGLLSISLTGTAAIVQGTGTNCGSTQTALSGTIPLTTAAPVPFNGGNSPILIGTSANAVCITAATGNVTGWFTYAKF